MPKELKCIRCGVCCIMAPCGEDKSDETGVCPSLTIHKGGYTSCAHIEKYGNVFGGGCFLRERKYVYKLHREEAERRVGIKLVGIKTANASTTK